MRRLSLLPPVLAALLSGCVPYAVGTTAVPVPDGELTQGVTVQLAAGQPALEQNPGEQEARTTSFTFDNEVRFGLDAASDAGVRLVGSSGILATYKRKLSPPGDGPALALLVGGGLIGLGRHAHVEATFLSSLPPQATFTPYGGLRVQHLFPLANDASAPAPAVGGFFGARLGQSDLGFSPEIGLFYSPTDVLFESDWIVVPSVTVHGDRLLQALGIGF